MVTIWARFTGPRTESDGGETACYVPFSRAATYLSG